MYLSLTTFLKRRMSTRETVLVVLYEVRKAVDDFQTRQAGRVKAAVARQPGYIAYLHNIYKARPQTM